MRVLAIALVVCLMAAGRASGATGDPAIDLLLEKLAERGVIGEEEAAKLEKDLGEAVEKRNRPLPFELELRMQARLDSGDLLVGSDGRYRTESDLYLRRARLGVVGRFEKPPAGKELEVNITFDADRTEQDFRGGERDEPENRLDLRYMYADWTFADAFAVKLGKHKLPFSRISLTSSGRQLLIERPVSTETAKDLLGDYQQAQIQFHGELAHGVLRYQLAGGDGANSLGRVRDLDGSAEEVRKRSWGNAFLGRLELSPLPPADGGEESGSRDGGGGEKKKDDTGMGEESHLTLGIGAGFQEDIEYAAASVADASLATRLYGADLAGRYRAGTLGTFTGQVEYVTFRKNFSYKADEEPAGVYLQLGCLLPGEVLRGRLEPAVRYEIFDRDRSGNEGGAGDEERTLTLGFNHYLAQHRLKWSYNFARTRFDRGVAEAAGERSREIHQALLQLDF